MSGRKRGHKPTEPEPTFRWVDDECAGVNCGCGAKLLMGTGHPTRCPACKRIYELHQRNWLTERDSSSINACPFCGGVRYDDGSFCPECMRDSDGKTANELVAEYWAARTKGAVST